MTSSLVGSEMCIRDRGGEVVRLSHFESRLVVGSETCPKQIACEVLVWVGMVAVAAVGCRFLSSWLFVMAHRIRSLSSWPTGAPA
eukprot:6337609-Prorocentrum_lima.AAC.1